MWVAQLPNLAKIPPTVDSNSNSRCSNNSFKLSTTATLHSAAKVESTAPTMTPRSQTTHPCFLVKAHSRPTPEPGSICFNNSNRYFLQNIKYRNSVKLRSVKNIPKRREAPVCRPSLSLLQPSMTFYTGRRTGKAGRH